MKHYWKRLRHHPGVSIATTLTLVLPLAGAANVHQNIWWVGVLTALLVWIPVLITARTQPLPEDE